MSINKFLIIKPMNRIKLAGMIMFAMIAALPLFVSCSSSDDDEVQVDTTPIELPAGRSTIVTGAKTIEVADGFVAQVEGDTVEGYHVGETYVTVNGNIRIPVTVTGGDPGNVPTTEWGSSYEYVRNNQKKGLYGILSTKDSLMFLSVGNAEYYTYKFKDDKLVEADIIILKGLDNQFKDFLNLYFLELPTTKEGVYYRGINALTIDKATTGVTMEDSEDSYLYYVIRYVPIQNFK